METTKHVLQGFPELPKHITSLARNLPGLPWEVLYLIMSFIPVKHLPIFILTCQSFRRIGEILLYRYINLINSPIRSFLLLRTLIESPYLAGFIRIFQVAENIEPLGSGQQKPWNMESVKLIACGKLSNVEAIAVPSTIHCHRDDFFVHAKKVRILCSRDDHFPLALVNSLPDLTHFEITMSYGMATHVDYSAIRSGHSPHLHELIAPLEMALLLVPGRPVERLYLTFPLGWSSADATQTVSTVQQTTKKIVTLGLSFISQSDRNVQQVLLATSISLNDMEEFCLRFDSPWMGTLFGVLASLKNFLATKPLLRKLDLSGCTGPPSAGFLATSPQAPSQPYIDVLNEWKACCPSLGSVAFPNGSVWLYAAEVWQRQNTLAPSRNPIDWRTLGTLKFAESWGDPMFERDLEREWSDELVAELKHLETQGLGPSDLAQSSQMVEW